MSCVEFIYQVQYCSLNSWAETPDAGWGNTVNSNCKRNPPKLLTWEPRSTG